jgi:hypothetical protein
LPKKGHQNDRNHRHVDRRLRSRPQAEEPWPALWALVIGFFMILVDTTIVSVANPAIKAALDPSTNNLDNVVWVTSPTSSPTPCRC